MNWTTQYPTQPGLYWLRNYQIKGWRATVTTLEPTIVEVDTDGDFYHIGSEETQFRQRVIYAEWFGPIQPPPDENPHYRRLVEISGIKRPFPFFAYLKSRQENDK